MRGIVEDVDLRSRRTRNRGGNKIHFFGYGNWKQTKDSRKPRHIASMQNSRPKFLYHIITSHTHLSTAKQLTKLQLFELDFQVLKSDQLYFAMTYKRYIFIRKNSIQTHSSFTYNPSICCRMIQERSRYQTSPHRASSPKVLVSNKKVPGDSFQPLQRTLNQNKDFVPKQRNNSNSNNG